jgi:hypothetical protein
MSEDRSHRNGAAGTAVAEWPDNIHADGPF